MSKTATSLEKRLSELEKSMQSTDKQFVTSEAKAEIMTRIDGYLLNMEKLPSYFFHDDFGSLLENDEVENEGESAESVIETLFAEVVEPGLNPASGGHLGYIPGGGLPLAALGDYIAAISNKYAGVYYGGPGAVKLENNLIRWMCKMVGYGDESFGNLASGGSIANLTALVAARDKYAMVGAKAQEGVIYLSQQAHHCIDKAIRIAGLSVCKMRYVAMDDHCKISPKALSIQIQKDLEAGLKPFMIIASAGTTDTGVIDPLDQIADLAEHHGLWFHVDAAYGGFFMLVPELFRAFKGIERSDSVVLDPHKGLFLPYGIGTVLVKNKDHLLSSFGYDANYMQDTSQYQEEISPSQVSPELTKHFRGLRMWLPLKIHGLDFFRTSLLEKHLLTRYFQSRLEEIGFKTGPLPELSVGTYWYETTEGACNDLNKKILNYVNRKSKVFVSSTILEDKFVLRIAVLSFRTHKTHVDTLLSHLEEAVNQLTERT